MHNLLLKFLNHSHNHLSVSLSSVSTQLLLMVLSISPVMAQESALTQGPQAYGIDAKRPVFAASCQYCPYGAIANVVKAAMKPYGYDVQICFNCASTTGIRQVSGRLVPPQPEPRQEGAFESRIMGPRMPVPRGALDFGVINAIYAHRAYEGLPGRGNFDKDGPRRNLRIFAMLDYPAYTIVAATKESGITDLSQLIGRNNALHVMVDHHRSMEVLAYYGLTAELIETAGGSLLDNNNRTDYFDLVIFDGNLSNAPEQDIWYEITQKHDLIFLSMPEELLSKLAEAPGYERRTLPLGYFRGLDHNIPTVARSDYALFGREDASDEFAYDVARALDENSELWMWAPVPLYYNPTRAWDTKGRIPLHPGAERYYREKGYFK